MRDSQGRFLRGHPQFNTGRTHIKKGTKLRLGVKHSEGSKRKMSIAKKGRMPANLEIIRNYKPPRGPLSPLWKGGKDESKTWRTRIEYHLWRKSVFMRDEWTCQKCKIKGTKLHPHHIKSFGLFHELRFAIDNGVTLCVQCHKNLHKKYGNKTSNFEYISEFLEEH